LNINEVQQYTLSRLQDTDVKYNTYQFMCIPDLFPEDFYNEIKNSKLEDASALVHSVFNSEEFTKELFRKFSDSPKRSETIRSIYSFHQSHGRGYTLKPHVDSYPRVFTMTVYLANDNKTPEAGTAVYSVDKNTKQWKTIDMMPYLKNSCMIICPYDDLTWHGVNILEKDIDRDSIVVVFSAEKWNESQIHYAEWKPGKTVNYGI